MKPEAEFYRKQPSKLLTRIASLRMANTLVYATKFLSHMSSNAQLFLIPLRIKRHKHETYSEYHVQYRYIFAIGRQQYIIWGEQSLYCSDEPTIFQNQNEIPISGSLLQAKFCCWWLSLFLTVETDLQITEPCLVFNAYINRKILLNCCKYYFYT